MKEQRKRKPVTPWLPFSLTERLHCQMIFFLPLYSHYPEEISIGVRNLWKIIK